MTKEKQNIEFKATWRDEFLKWICGFANAQGGILIIGKDDNGRVKHLAKARKLLEDIPNQVRDILGLIVDVNLHTVDGNDYLEIVVEPYPFPISLRGKYYYRTGSTLQELKGAALKNFFYSNRVKNGTAYPFPILPLMT